MEQVEIKLENCYGIKELEKKFEFSQGKVNTVYAKNGLMKTSLTKVFERIQRNKKAEICDEIFGCHPVTCDIKVNGSNIDPEEIFVIKSFESHYESDSLLSLLIDDELKEELNKVIKLRDKFLNILEVKSGKKVTKTIAGKKIYELEETIIEDFGFEEKSLLLNVGNINLEGAKSNLSNITYSQIFDPSVIRKIISDEFQTKIGQYLVRSDEIYAKYSFFDKGNFTLPKLKDIQKGFNKNSFFVKNNRVILDGNIEIKSITELQEQIKEVESELKDSIEFKGIEKLLSDAKGTLLKDIIETHPEIIEELRLENLESFKKKLWLSYMSTEKERFKELQDKYKELDEHINNAEIDDTPWREALDIFNKRFTVPFHMEISNLKSSIIGESIPRVVFGFCKDGNINNLDGDNWVKFDREELESKNTLSQGEKRALYLLNIIFDIEKRRRENKRTLFIIDDIADSFDYKNKYAIVEYLKDISLEDKFYMIIFTHNFDFYRTVSSRLNVWRSHRHDVQKNADKIIINEEFYQDKPFQFWKKRLTTKHILALIPFVRNLVEYGVDKKVNSFDSIDEDFLLLTSLLHMKEYTLDIKIKDLKEVYKEYIGKDNFIGVDEDTTVIVALKDVVSGITSDENKLENKIMMSMAIRIISEKHMIKTIKSSICEFTWKGLHGEILNGNKDDILVDIFAGGNQTRKLFNAYRQVGEQNQIKILESVNIMTPENIHMNSFMYEPILDMDIIELKKLYDDVCDL